jgi:hypothetical protein
MHSGPQQPVLQDKTRTPAQVWPDTRRMIS